MKVTPAMPCPRPQVSALTVLLLLALTGSLALAAPAADADTETAASGPITAQLSYNRESSQLYDQFTDLAVTIARDGSVLYRSSLYDKNCEDTGDAGSSCHPANRLVPSDQAQSISLRDLDLDGEPEAIVDLRLGGTHDRCYTLFYRYTPPTYTALNWLFQEPCYKIRSLGDGPEPELVTADGKFTFRFAISTGEYVRPIRIWRYLRGKLINVTRGFPQHIRTDSKRAWNFYRGDASGPGGGLGALAAWTADQYLLGRRGRALRTLRRLNRRGQLTTHPIDGFELPNLPTGRRYIRTLDRYLRGHGYRSK